MPQSCCVVGCANKKTKGIEIAFPQYLLGEVPLKKEDGQTGRKRFVENQKYWDIKTTWPDE